MIALEIVLFFDVLNLRCEKGNSHNSPPKGKLPEVTRVPEKVIRFPFWDLSIALFLGLIWSLVWICIFNLMTETVIYRNLGFTFILCMLIKFRIACTPAWVFVFVQPPLLVLLFPTLSQIYLFFYIFAIIIIPSLTCHISLLLFLYPSSLPFSPFFPFLPIT